MRWTPHREPLRTTVRRTFGIAAAIGAVFALRAGRLELWPIASLLALWLSFGGHWVEVAFLNGVRPRISPARVWQVLARLAVWLVGGVGLGAGMALTMQLFSETRRMHGPPWWSMGLAFVGLELLVHAVLALRKRPSFWDGEG